MAVKEVTPETEFDKGFNSVDAPVSKKADATEEVPVISKEEKPVEVVEEVKKEIVAEEKPEVKVEDTQKAKVSKPDTSKPVIEVDDNSATYKQRWKSQEGIVKSKDTKIAELEAEIAKFKTEQKPVEDKIVDTILGEIDKLEAEYLDALIEDDKPLAIKIRKQIDDIRFKQFAEITKQTARDEASSTAINQANTDKVKTIVEKSIAKFPFLDHTNDKTGNPYAIRLVKATRDDYISQGMEFVEALESAVAEIAPMFDTKAKSSIEVVEESIVNDDKVKSTVVVETKNAPVKLGGKPKGLQTFDEGFDSVKPFG